jgi:glycosyltransferase involved in cell wall biosynthesis
LSIEYFTLSILESVHRLVLVTRKFWPMSDDSSHRLLQLVDGLRTCGIDLHVLTARWHPSWPENLTLRRANVTRILPPPRNNWNEAHFQKQIVSWLTQHVDTYDSIYVDRADGLLAAITAKASKWKKPVIARYSIDTDTQGVTKGQCVGSAAAADACRRCDRIIAPSAAAHRALISQSIDSHRIDRIPDWTSIRVERSQESRAAAAAALFQVSSDLVIPGRTDLIVHYGTAETSELMPVVQAVCDLLDRGASVRMWILGSGFAHVDILDAIKDRGWHREILLFDGFDDLEEIVEVADLAIVSNPSVAYQFSALMFLHSDVPVITADGPETKSWLAEGQPIKSYRDSHDLLNQLLDWQIHRQQWIAEAAVCRAHSLAQRHSPAACISQWETILRTTSIGTIR